MPRPKLTDLTLKQRVFAARSASAKKGWETRREKAAKLKAAEVIKRRQEAYDFVAAIQAQGRVHAPPPVQYVPPKPDWECRHCKAEIGWLGRFLMWLKLPMCSVYATCGQKR